MWQTRFYPELLLLPNDYERKTAIMQAQKRASAFGLRTLAGYAAFVVALCGVFALAEFAKPWLPWLLILLILGVVNLSLILFGGYFLWHSPIRAELRRDLADRGMPICRQCGYNITGLTEPRCPECGQPFEQADLRCDPADSESTRR